MLGCSGDSVETQAKFEAKYNLNFPLLSDPEFEAIEAYGARRMKQFLGKSFLGIVRCTFLIAPGWPHRQNLGQSAVQRPRRRSSAKPPSNLTGRQSQISALQRSRKSLRRRAIHLHLHVVDQARIAEARPLRAPGTKAAQPHHRLE